MSVRTRIAPSPTGLLHVGNARTALFNWLFARKEGGVFIVRVEDTDLERSKPEFEADALLNFEWLGLDWDEGPVLPARQDWPPSVSEGEAKPSANPERQRAGERTDPIESASDEIGDYGPYRQSRRGEIYKRYLEELYEEGRLYHCFCTREELEAMRQSQLARGEAPRYIGRCRELSPHEATERTSRGVPWVLRFKVPDRKVVVHDLVRGQVEFDTSLTGDAVVAKDFTHPVFHFAVVVDDFTMEISHVIRGEDHLSNTPLHMLLQEALGFTTPQYAHLPLLLGSDRTKLSKRHGATAVTEYREAGYLPEAMMNFLALLGWHPHDDREVLLPGELVQQFSLKDVQKSAAIFNGEKLRWLNSEYMKNMAPEELAERIDGLPVGERFDKIYIAHAIKTVQTRAKTLQEVRESIDFYFNEPDYSPELLAWKQMNGQETGESLERARSILDGIKEDSFTETFLESALLAEAAKSGDRGKLLWPLRVALSGQKASPSPFEIAAVLGKQKTLERIEKAIMLAQQP